MEKKIEELIRKYRAKYRVEYKKANDFAHMSELHPDDTTYKRWRNEHQSDAIIFKEIVNDLNELIKE